jgi:hypothetical protein
MPIATNNDFLASLKPRNRVNKISTAALIVGRLRSLWQLNGTPAPAAANIPAAGAALAYDRTSQGALAPFAAPGGANVFYLAGTRLRAVSTSAGLGADIDFYDRLTAQSFAITAAGSAAIAAQALPRYTAANNTDQVEMFIENTGTVAIGVTTTLTITYTNSANVASRSTTVVIPASMAAVDVIPVPLQSGDTGVLSVQSVSLSVLTSGPSQLTIVLAKYIGVHSCPFTNLTGDVQDYAELGLPNITTSPCLWMVLNPNTTATLAISGSVNFNEFTP